LFLYVRVRIFSIEDSLLLTSKSAIGIAEEKGDTSDRLRNPRGEVRGPLTRVAGRIARCRPRNDGIIKGKRKNRFLFSLDALFRRWQVDGHERWLMANGSFGHRGSRGEAFLSRGVRRCSFSAAPVDRSIDRPTDRPADRGASRFILSRIFLFCSRKGHRPIRGDIVSAIDEGEKRLSEAFTRALRDASNQDRRGSM